MSIGDVFEANGGLATTRQLLAVTPRRNLASKLRAGAIVRVWHGVYALSPPDLSERLRALDIITGRKIVACMASAAEMYGFDTERDDVDHILDPGVRMRPNAGLTVHQRLGAPLRKVDGRLATAPAWTAVEIARTLRRPRALAVLDAALHQRACTPDELDTAIREQKGRRGIVKVRELVAHANRLAESPMESESRLVFIDGGLPLPELQYEIVDSCDRLWRVDFAWPQAMLVAEYDSVEFHANPVAFTYDRLRTSRLQECGWTVIPIVLEDVRKAPLDLVARISHHLERAALIG